SPALRRSGRAQLRGSKRGSDQLLEDAFFEAQSIRGDESTARQQQWATSSLILWIQLTGESRATNATNTLPVISSFC
ncbi:hypothetical protein MPH_03108, partial [Macrophomina phaseolina MS6]